MKNHSENLNTLYVDKPLAGLCESLHLCRYQDFLNQSGIMIKEEDRVRVSLWELSTDGKGRKFVFKEYRYGKGNFLTWWPAKARREHHNLQVCHKLGVPAVKPVAYGVQRSALKTVNSCFLMTEFVEDAVNLKKRIHESANWRRDSSLQTIFRELGTLFRRLHSRHFFVYSSSTRNVLIEEKAGLQEIRIRLLDMPYARFVFNTKRGCKAQSKDLGTLLKLPLLFGGSHLVDAFFQTYLPDPLGSSTPEFKHRLHQAARVQDNRTLWSDLENRFKRRLKNCLTHFSQIH